MHVFKLFRNQSGHLQKNARNRRSGARRLRTARDQMRLEETCNPRNTSSFLIKHTTQNTELVNALFIRDAKISVIIKKTLTSDKLH